MRDLALALLFLPPDLKHAIAVWVQTWLIRF